MSARYRARDPIGDHGTVRFSILGPLTVHDVEGRDVPVAGARLRALLVLLLLHPGRAVGADQLVDGIWPDAPPAGAANALQALVSRLRRILGRRAPVRGEAGGYRLEIQADQVDLWCFEESVRRARAARDAGDPLAAEREYAAALALWRGPALADVAGVDAAEGIAIRLSRLRRAAVVERLEALVDLGRYAEALPDIEAEVARDPLSEPPVGLLMRALAGDGRQAEALTAYERLRRDLAEELGADPSRPLRDLHTRLLRDEAGGRRPPVAESSATVCLPHQMTSFVGRDTEVETVIGLLARERLVTLTGPGGAGKTRLSIEAAARHARRCRHRAVGVWFVELAPVTDGAAVANTVLAALGLRERAVVGLGVGGAMAVSTPLERLREALTDRPVLLVLDNCEHLVREVAEFTARLLAACPEVRVLATSREPLGVAGEHLVTVGSLPLPPADATPAQALASPSVRLFVERAAALSPGFAVDDESVGHVVRICRELDGIPLALELAAARARAMPPALLAARLSDRFRLLSSAQRLASPRHRTLQAVVDWSWDLLDDAERALLRRLAVFANGATLEAVERVCADPGAPGLVGGRDVWSTLFALVDKSLVTVEERPGDTPQTPRYRMLETVRAYGLERLAEEGERERVGEVHAREVLRLWTRADPRLRGPDQLRWMARLHAECDNLTAALRWASDRRDVELGLDLAHAAQWYWQTSGRWSDAARWSSTLVALAGERPTAGHVVAYAECLTVMAVDGEDPGEIDALLSRVEELMGEAGEELQDHPNLVFVPLYHALLAAGTEAVSGLGTVATLESALERIMAWPRQDDPWLRAMRAFLEGIISFQVGRAEYARERLTAAVEGFRRSGDRWGIAQVLTSLAEILRFSDVEAERAALDEGMRLAEEMGLIDAVAVFRIRLASVEAEQGRLDQAYAHLRAVRRPADSGILEGQLSTVVRLAEVEVAWRAGDHDRAEEVLRGLLPVPESTGVALRAQLQVIWHWYHARVAIDRGRHRAAGEHLAAAWDSAQGFAGGPDLAALLETVAVLFVAEGRQERAATLMGYAEALRGLPDLTGHEAARVREALREVDTAAIHERARQATRAQIIAEVDGWLRDHRRACEEGTAGARPAHRE
ncbi:BTAD domain-containing putative transcriptional regulator [Marinactinospora endophytica]